MLIMQQKQQQPVLIQALLFVICLPYWILASWLEFAYRVVRPKRKSVCGQVALVTGAGAGIGQLICVRLARLGGQIAAWDVNPESLETTRELLATEAPGIRCEIFVCDVSSRDACYAVAKATIARMGRVDIAVQNAGILQGRELLDSDDDFTERVFQVNLLSHYWITKALLPHMLARGSGHMFYTASIAAWVGARRLADYCASKAADLIFTESLESELRSSHPNASIPVTTLCPYLIRTGMFQGCSSPMEALLPTLDPRDVADRAVAAILAEESVVIMPRIIHVIVALKYLLPRRVYMAVLRIANVDNFMDPFRGSTSAAADGKSGKSR